MNRERAKELLVVIFLAYTIALMVHACISPMWYSGKETGWLAEYDSIALPAISLQYRGSVFPKETDLERAAEDFPGMYQAVSDKDKGRNCWNNVAFFCSFDWC